MRTIGRHNPITNPIEYHIDNPYILKKIQERNILERWSIPTILIFKYNIDTMIKKQKL